MPEQTFNIGYGFNDFFYSENNANDLLKTLPFHKGNLITWTNRNKTSGATDINNTEATSISVFDPRITTVVFLNDTTKMRFINDYLPGNILINNTTNFSNFNTRNTNLNIPASAINNSSIDNTTGLVSGNISISTNNTKTPNIIYDFSVNNTDKTNVEYKTNALGQMGDDITINGTFNNEETKIIEPGSGAGSSYSYITKNTSNPRCKYRSKCTTDHWHYKSCKTQNFINPDGTTYCRCVCTGPPVKNNTEHQHCSPYKMNDANSSTFINGDDTELTNSISNLIRDIKVTIKKKAEPTLAPHDASSNNFHFAYTKLSDLSNNDLTIRTLIYNYYHEMNRNIQLRDSIIHNDSIDSTAKQALLDANVKYKKEYLQLFNIFSGIFFVSGYIYIMNK